MLGLLVSSCGRRSQFLQLPRYHVHTKINTARDFSARLKSINKLVRNLETKTHRSTQGTSKSNGLSRHTLIFGGFGVSVALCGRHFLYKHQVRCEGNRLSGVLQKTLMEDENKFDWKRFLSYLWKLVCAIAEALLRFKTVASNASTYAKETLQNVSINDIKEPATILLSSYLLPSGVTLTYLYLLSRMGNNPVMIKIVDKVFDDLNLPVYNDLKRTRRNNSGGRESDYYKTC
ncbi:uncharacterized protein LOC119685671 [Teleopsis dalmanni]|uniref:uncharacterized protein LOC119685670 n=1 Tax=Teleopsis dalmanni TaxID=139649 RepID=UPI0018CE3549|nr:uncharacterized protein LOC119685670 [Teleopsis dalmanni]XP_037955954.1 uncharacterized protein LOC119685671 [Teleopsis dalmanni]